MKDKIILITGGTGSFGNQLLQTLLTTDFKEVRIFSRDEKKQEDMRISLANPKIKFYIGDIRNRESIDDAMKGVDYVFHAAALKQVPSCEFFPMEAVNTNIIGSNNVIKSAIDNKVKKLICLSTDKAVYPINAMGVSKAMMEKLVQANARNLTNNDTILSVVRYGNVMYSRGSVIPLFVKQIKENKPITITEPTMTRFLLPLAYSVDLVLFAFKNASQGDIFIKKAPASTVEDLAAAIKRLFKSNIETRIIGIRHGEKIYETLATKEELSHAEDMGAYFRITSDTRDLNYNKYVSEGEKLPAQDDYHSHNTYRLTIDEIEKLLLSLPEIQEELKSRNA